MLLNVIDMEMNSPLDGSRGLGSIIQIAGVCMDMKSGKVKATFNQFVNPQETLDPRIIELTGITQAQVDAGRSLKFVLDEMFWQWTASKHMCAWGSDVEQLIELTEMMGLPVPEGLHLYDAKAISSILRCAFPSSRARGGLKDTMDVFGVPFVGRQHDALNDAMSTADLLHFYVKVTRGFFDMKNLVLGAS